MASDVTCVFVNLVKELSDLNTFLNKAQLTFMKYLNAQYLIIVQNEYKMDIHLHRIKSDVQVPISGLYCIL